MERHNDGVTARRERPDIAKRARAPDEPARADSGFDVKDVAWRVGLFAAVAVAGVALIATLPGVGEVRDRLASASPVWIAAAGLCSVGSMLGFVRALWSAFDRVMPWRRALELGLAEQGANVLLPAGGTGGPALGTFVMRRIGVPAELAAQRHAALFLATSAVSFVALVLAGTGVATGVLPGRGVARGDAAPGRRRGSGDRARGRVRAPACPRRAAWRVDANHVVAAATLPPRRRPDDRRAAPPR